MEYRKFEKLGVSPSLLGFGCMRFPLNPDGSICEEEAEKMVDTAIQAGVTYIDTAYPYHNGDSEPFLGRILKKYNRKDYFLATKLPIWNVKTLDDAKRLFDEQLQRLDTEYVDFYLLHCLDKEKWQTVLDLNLIPYFEELKAQGKIRFFGFSFHDDFEVFEQIATYRKWDFCQIQYNYVDTDIQAGDKGYALTESLGIPLVIMEPVKGGSLSFLPDDIAASLKAERPDSSISSWALRWVASKPNVKVVLSGMSTMEQVEDNLHTFGKFEPLTEKETNLIAKTADNIKKRTKNGCTGCAYCMPCPFGVDIPKNFRIWNELSMYGNKEKAKQAFFHDLNSAARADQCQKCGKCETVCPQGISIRENLAEAANDFNKLK
ncbi:General stress protein 69 [uncultured Blautia sp.]